MQILSVSENKAAAVRNQIMRIAVFLQRINPSVGKKTGDNKDTHEAERDAKDRQRPGSTCSRAAIGTVAQMDNTGLNGNGRALVRVEVFRRLTCHMIHEADGLASKPRKTSGRTSRGAC